MLGLILNLPPAIDLWLAQTTVPEIAAIALLIIAPWPMVGILVWGLTHIWVDFKQEKYEHSLKYQLLEIRVPPTSIQTPKGMENFFANLSGSKTAITWKERWLLGKAQAKFTFEIVSRGGQISFYVRTQTKYRDLLEADFYAQYPEAQITEIEDYVDIVPTSWPHPEWDLFGMEFALKKDDIYPIKTYEDFEHQGEKEGRFKDPLLPMLEFMGKVHPDEQFWMQIIIQAPDTQDWAKEGLQYLSKAMGRDVSAHAPGMVSQILSGAGTVPAEFVRQITGVDLAGTGGEHKEVKKDDFKMFRLTPAERTQMEYVAEKIAKIGWNTKIRILYAGKKKTYRKGMFASGMKGMMAIFDHSYMNGFGVHAGSVPKDDYFFQLWQMPSKQRKLIKRYAARSIWAGAKLSVLNGEELASIFHFPGVDARVPVMSTATSRRGEAPAGLTLSQDDANVLMNWKEESGKLVPSSEFDSDQPPILPTPTAPTDPTPISIAPIIQPLLQETAREELTPTTPIPAHMQEDSAPGNLPIG